jgi:hypothetical protein
MGLLSQLHALLLSQYLRYVIMGQYLDMSLYKPISTIIPCAVAALFIFKIVHFLGVIFKISTGFVYIDFTCLIVIRSICYVFILSIFFRQHLTQSVNQLKNKEAKIITQIQSSRASTHDSG